MRHLINITMLMDEAGHDAADHAVGAEPHNQKP